MALKQSMEDSEHLKAKVFWAASEGHAKDIKLLLANLDASRIQDILNHSVPWRDDLDSIRRHLSKSQRTPLTVAASHGHLEVVKLLVEDYNVDINQRVQEVYLFVGGMTALTAAAWHGFLKIVRFLLEKDPTQKARHPELLVLACQSGNFDMVKYLVENGVNIEEAKKSGKSCFIAAWHSWRILTFLLDHGVDPNEKDSLGNTALHYAAYANRPGIVKMLLQRGAILSKNNQGLTPLMKAVSEYHCKVVEVIMRTARLTPTERINAYELFGAKLGLKPTTDVYRSKRSSLNPMSALAIAYQYLRKAMEERHWDPANVISKPFSLLPTLTNVQESQNLQELKTRWSDRHTRHLECLAVLHRLSGQSLTEFGAYASSLKREYLIEDAEIVFMAGNILNKEEAYFDEVYLKNSVAWLREEFLMGHTPRFAFSQHVLELAMILLQQEKKQKPMPRDVKEKLFNICLSCVLASLKVAQREEDREVLRTQVQRLVRLRTCLPGGFSMLHAAVACYWTGPAGLEGVQDLSFDWLVSLLVQCRADVNALDNYGNTPLHVLASRAGQEDADEIVKSMVDCLVEAGTVLHIQNNKGQTVLATAGGKAVADFLRPLWPLSLKSLAAMVVSEHNIPTAGEIPKELEDFLHLAPAKSQCDEGLELQPQHQQDDYKDEVEDEEEKTRCRDETQEKNEDERGNNPGNQEHNDHRQEQEQQQQQQQQQQQEEEEEEKEEEEVDEEEVKEEEEEEEKTQVEDEDYEYDDEYYYDQNNYDDDDEDDDDAEVKE